MMKFTVIKIVYDKVLVEYYNSQSYHNLVKSLIEEEYIKFFDELFDEDIDELGDLYWEALIDHFNNTNWICGRTSTKWTKLYILDYEPKFINV